MQVLYTKGYAGYYFSAALLLPIAQQHRLIHHASIFHDEEGGAGDPSASSAVDERYQTLTNVLSSRSLTTENDLIQRGLLTLESKAIAQWPGR